MFNAKYAYVIAAAASFSVAAAQRDSTTIQRNVDVVNAYLPTLSNPFKMQVDPVIDDTMSYSPSFRYDVLAKTQTVKTNPDSLAPAPMFFRPEQTNYHALAKLSGGNYTSIFGQLIYNIGLSEKYHVALDLGHHSMLGDVKLQETDEKVEAPTGNTWVTAESSILFEKSALDANLAFHNNTYRYYGYQNLDSTRLYTANEQTVAGSELFEDPKQKQTTFDLDLCFGNRLIDPREKFSYTIGAGFGTFSNKTEVKQTDIRANVGIRIPFSTNYYLDAKVRFNNANIKTPDSDRALYHFTDRKHTDVHIIPHFGIDYDYVQIRAGLNFIVEVGDEEDSFYMQPDIFADFNISDGAVTLYLGLTGGYKANTFRELASENPYIASDACNYVWKASDNTFDYAPMQTTQNPIRMIAGLKAKIGRKVAMDVGVNYASFDDEMFFINKGFTYANNANRTDYNNTFSLISENGKVTKVHLDLNVTPNEATRIELKGVYNQWKTDYLEEAWYKPAYEISLDTRFKPIEKLAITAGAKVLGERYGLNRTTSEKQKLDTALDIYLTGEYRLTSRWTVFLNLDNIAAQDIVKYIGYSTYRFNANAGVTFKF